MNPEYDFDISVFGHNFQLVDQIPKRCHWPRIGDVENGITDYQVLGLPENPKLDEMSRMYKILTDLLDPTKHRGKSTVVQTNVANLRKRVQTAYKRIISNYRQNN